MARPTTCSFCGTAESPLHPLARRPQVNICAICAQRATQNLTTRNVR